MIFKLSGVCFLISYLMVFPAFLILRYRQPDQPRPYRMPGGPVVAWTTAVVCTACVAGAILLFFRPPPTAENPGAALNETWLLLAETLITLGVGLAFLPRVHRR